MSTLLSLRRHSPALSIAFEAARGACLLAARACGRAARALRERSRRAEDRDLLLAMSTRELNDLALGRGDVERIAAAPADEAWKRA
jgi:uncharacterized protein YjiS (DUF1127 family)